MWVVELLDFSLFNCLTILSSSSLSISSTPGISVNKYVGTADVSLLWLVWDSVSCMLDAGCRMAFLAVSPSSFTFFFRNSLHSGQRQTSWNEWKQPCKRVQSSSWLEMLHRGKSHFFVWSGLISQWYPKGKTVIFIFLLGDIVGSVTWVGTLVLQLLFEENWLCPGLWEIFINMEDSAWAHLTFSKRSWLCEKENCLGVVKNDL